MAVRHWQFTVAVAAVLCGHAQAAWASDFLSTTWRTEDGLPHSTINSIVQSRDGYLWLGTYVGVVRFDGVRFVHYSTANLPQLGPGRVSKLFEDRDGTLWVGLESGRLVAWKDGQARIHLPNSPSGSDAIISMVQDRSGTIWLQTSSGHFGRLTSDSVQFVANTGPTSLRSALGLLRDDAGALWVGTKDGLRIWQNGHLEVPPGIPAAANQPVDTFARARDGGIWIFQEHRLRKLRNGRIENELAAPPGFDGAAVDLLESGDGRIWVAGGSGSVFCRQPDGLWEPLSTEFGLRGNNKTLFEDREGNVWRGSFGGGLTRLRPKIFTAYRLPETEFDRYASGVCADSVGNAWMLLNPQTVGFVTRGDGPESLRTWQQQTSFRTIYSDRAGAIWLGCGDGRIGRWRDGKFVPELKVNPEGDLVSAFFEDNRSNLWAGFSQGKGAGFMPQGDVAKWQTVEGLTYPDVRAIAQTPDGAMWFGTHYGGAFRFEQGHWTRLTTRDGLPSDYVRCLHADADGTLWLGTIHGLARWRNGALISITSENGLWHDALSAILEDGHGNLWMSSFGGVFRAARKELNEFADGRRASVQCVGYDHNDGVSALESPGGFQPAGAKTSDGRLWFPTVDGVVAVAPDRLTDNKIAPPVVLEEISVDGNSSANPNATGAFEIPPGKRRIEFRFTALSLAAPEKVRFRHKLEGLDKEWSAPDDRRTAAYNFVPAGQYTFRVMACNNDGLWNTAGAAVGFVVSPFFWRTWWFQTGLGLILAGALAGAVRKRERRRAQLKLQRLEREHAVERERSRIAQDIHDEVGASLTQIAFLSDRVELTSKDPAEVAHWNGRVREAARRTIQSLDEIVWAVSPEHDTLESLANYVAKFAQEHLSLAGVRCTLDVLTVLPPITVSAELRHNILLAVREGLQNAVAHAGAAEIKVALDLRDDALEIRIQDDGRGFDPCPANGEGEGHGLVNMRKRLEEIGGRCEIFSEPGRGTRLRFIVPRGRLNLCRQ